MKRYYMTDLIGDGSEENPFRPAVANLGVSHVAVFPPQDLETGQYQGTTCLVLVNTVNHAQVIADPRNDPMPDFPLDGKLSAMRASTQQELVAMLRQRGFTYPDGWLSLEGYRDIIRTAAQQLDPSFDEDAFDVAE